MKKETDGDRVRQVLAEWRGMPDGGGAYNMAGERVVSGFYGADGGSMTLEEYNRIKERGENPLEVSLRNKRKADAIRQGDAQRANIGGRW